MGLMPWADVRLNTDANFETAEVKEKEGEENRVPIPPFGWYRWANDNEEETPKPYVEAENQIGEEIEEELTTNPASEIVEEKEQGTESIHSNGMVRLVYLNTPATMRFKKGNTKETYVNEGESEGTTGEQVINAADTAIVNVEKNHKGGENVDGTLINKVEDKGQGSEHAEYKSDKMEWTDKEDIKYGMGEYKLVQKDEVCATKMNVLEYFFYFTTKL